MLLYNFIIFYLEMLIKFLKMNQKNSEIFSPDDLNQFQLSQI